MRFVGDGEWLWLDWAGKGVGWKGYGLGWIGYGVTAAEDVGFSRIVIVEMILEKIVI